MEMLKVRWEVGKFLCVGLDSELSTVRQIMGPEGSGFLTLAKLIIRIGEHVSDVHSAFFRQYAAGKRAAASLHRRGQHKIDERLRKLVVG